MESDNPDPRVIVREALSRHDAKALKLQRKRWTFALFAAWVGPFAVSLLVTQGIIFSTDRHRLTAIILIAMELFLLTWALAIAFLSSGRSHKEWIRERLRAEILRREEFLLLGRVGPYLNTPARLLACRLQERLLHIESEVTDPVSLLLMAGGETTWRDALEDSKAAGTLPILPDLAARVNTYIAERVAKQREWFSSKSRSHDFWSRFLENGAKLILTLALVVAAFHLGRLSQGAGDEPSMSDKLLLVVAIGLPAVGGAFVGLQSILGSEHLTRSFRYHAGALENLETSQRRLQCDLDCLDSTSGKELQFRFMRTVVSVEELLTQELQQWWLVMYPTAPRPGA